MVMDGGGGTCVRVPFSKCKCTRLTWGSVSSDSDLIDSNHPSDLNRNMKVKVSLRSSHFRLKLKGLNRHGLRR